MFFLFGTPPPFTSFLVFILIFLNHGPHDPDQRFIFYTPPGLFPGGTCNLVCPIFFFGLLTSSIGPMSYGHPHIFRLDSFFLTFFRGFRNSFCHANCLFPLPINWFSFSPILLFCGSVTALDSSFPDLPLPPRRVLPLSTSFMFNLMPTVSRKFFLDLSPCPDASPEQVNATFQA